MNRRASQNAFRQKTVFQNRSFIFYPAGIIYRKNADTAESRFPGHSAIPCAKNATESIIPDTVTAGTDRTAKKQPLFETAFIVPQTDQ